MATSDKIIQEAKESQSHSSADYKKAALASLAEILETIERIHRSQVELNQIDDRFDEIIAQLLSDSEKRIQHHKQEITRLESEKAALHARLLAA